MAPTVNKLFSNKMLGRASLIFSLLFFSLAWSQETKIIQIQKAGSSQQDESLFPGATILLRNPEDRVHLFHEGALIVSDRAYFYAKKNFFRAQGEVVFTQGDSLKMTCQQMEYDGQTQQAKAATSAAAAGNSDDATAYFAVTGDDGVTVNHFQRQEGVVIVTKIHGPHQHFLLEQAFCLLHKAYNQRMNYDMIVFMAIPLSQDEEDSLRRLVHPAKITYVLDNRGLQQEIQALSPIRREKFLKRCNVSSPVNLTWASNCPGRIAYNWQAEVR